MGIGILLSMTLINQAIGATCDRNYEASLDKAVSATISAVSGNNPGALLNQVGDQGLTFNTDGATVSYDALSAQFSSKTGRYCDLFSCGGKTGDLRRLFKRGKIDTQIDTQHGLATVFVNANTNDELDLSYRFTTKCKWELTGLGGA